MIIDKIDSYLNEMEGDTEDSTIQPAEFSSLVTGLKRIQYRFNKATTPKKYKDCFELVSKLVEKFPLKSKIIWGTVADAYKARFGEVSVTMDTTDTSHPTNKS
jgi:hypothetical protein